MATMASVASKTASLVCIMRFESSKIPVRHVARLAVRRHVRRAPSVSNGPVTSNRHSELDPPLRSQFSRIECLPLAEHRTLAACVRIAPGRAVLVLVDVLVANVLSPPRKSTWRSTRRSFRGSRCRAAASKRARPRRSAKTVRPRPGGHASTEKKGAYRVDSHMG